MLAQLFRAAMILVLLALPILSAWAHASEIDVDELDAFSASLFKAEQVFASRRATKDACIERWASLKHNEESLSKEEILENGAILLSEWADNADPDKLRAALDTLGAAVRSHLPSAWPGPIAWEGTVDNSTPAQLPRSALVMAIEAVNKELFESEGFIGDDRDYYDPANSFLSAVLRRKRGIPISLSVLWVVVVRRIGLQSGVLGRFPNHVLVRVPVAEGGVLDPRYDFYIDAFSGRVLRWDAVENFAAQLGIPDNPDLLRDITVMPSPAEVHARMLRNLRHIYIAKKDDGRLLGVLNHAIALGVPELEELEQGRSALLSKLQRAGAAM